jgi:hypothetical protein
VRSERVGKFRDVIEFLTAAGCTLRDRTLVALLARHAAVLKPLVAVGAASVPFVAIGNNVPPSRQAMLDHAGTPSGLLGREEQIAAAVLKLIGPWLASLHLERYRVPGGYSQA